MAEHLDPGNPTPEQLEDQAWECFRLRSQGHTILQIADKTGLSRESVKRRLNEKILSHSVTPREVSKAMADARLDTLTMHYLASLEVAHNDEIPKLLHAAVQVEKRRAALLGLDEPSQRDVKVTNGGSGSDFGEEPPTPMLPQWIRDYEESDLEQRMEAERNSDG